MRVCFDTASNYFWNGLGGYLNTPEQARCAFEGFNFRFDCATAVIIESRESFDYTDHRELFALLEQADEIVTFNGRTCDLIVLEKLLKPEESRKLWAKPHHDLKGWLEQSLEASAKRFSPELGVQYGRLRQQRVAILEVSKTLNDFQTSALAGTYRDAWVTFELGCAYLKSGNTDFTYTHPPG
jgi:hypothetical protein